MFNQDIILRESTSYRNSQKKLSFEYIYLWEILIKKSLLNGIDDTESLVPGEESTYQLLLLVQTFAEHSVFRLKRHRGLT